MPNIYSPFPIPITYAKYGIDAYQDWNNIPIGGGCGYWQSSWQFPNPTPLYDSNGNIIDQNYCYVDSIDGLKNALAAHPVYPAGTYKGICVIVFYSLTQLAPYQYSPEIDFSCEKTPIEIPENTPARHSVTAAGRSLRLRPF